MVQAGGFDFNCSDYGQQVPAVLASVETGLEATGTERSQSMPFDYEDQGSRDGRQSGTYRGIRTGVHCHFVGANDHLQIGEDRYPIRWLGKKKRDDKEKQAEIDLFRGAWTALKNKGDAAPGVADCKRWLRSYLVDYHKVNSSKVT